MAKISGSQNQVRLGKPKVENSGAAQIWVAIFQVQDGFESNPKLKFQTKFKVQFLVELEVQVQFTNCYENYH